MTMFHNQAQYAGQVGASMGFPNPNPGGPMASPMFTTDPVNYGHGIGSSIVGGASSAMPAAVAGTQIAAGLGAFGAAGAMFDPTDAFASGFARGAGSGGMGFFGSMANLGRTFSTSGFGAGARALAGGAAMGTASVLPHIALGMAATEIGTNMYAGAQRLSDTRAAMNAYTAPQYGQPGALSGGNFNTSQIKGFVNVMQQMASDDSVLMMKDVENLMHKFGQMGAFTNVSNAQQFKTKFKEMVDQVKTISEVMGTSLENASELFSSFKKMGVWRPSDVMGTSVAMSTLGPQGAQALMGAMASGAQGSHQRGGDLSAGAFLGRQSMMDVNQAVRSGVLSSQDILNLTGGVGGMDGQRIVAQQFTGMIQNMAYTPVGRLSMAGLGEFVNGQYTGNVDEDLLAQLKSGQISIDDLQRIGRRNTRTRGGAASFTARQDLLGQNLAATGGMDMMRAQLEQIQEKARMQGGGAALEQIMIQQAFGIGDPRQARALQDMMGNLDGLRDKSARRMESMMRERINELDRKRNRGFSGLNAAVDSWWERNISMELEKLGTELSANIDETFESASRWFTGYHALDKKVTTQRDRIRVMDMAKDSGIRKIVNRHMNPDMGRGGTVDVIRGQAFRDLRVGSSQLNLLKGLGLQTSANTTGEFTGNSGDLFEVYESSGFLTLNKEQLRESDARRIVDNMGTVQRKGLRGLVKNKSPLDESGLSIDDISSAVDNSFIKALSSGNFDNRVRGKDRSERIRALRDAVNNDPDAREALDVYMKATGVTDEGEAVSQLAMASDVSLVSEQLQKDFDGLDPRLRADLGTRQGVRAVYDSGIDMMRSLFTTSSRWAKGKDNSRIRGGISQQEADTYAADLDLREYILSDGKVQTSGFKEKMNDDKFREMVQVYNAMGDKKRKKVREEAFGRFQAADYGRESLTLIADRASMASGQIGLARNTEGLTGAQGEKLANLLGAFEEGDSLDDSSMDLRNLLTGTAGMDAKHLRGSGSSIARFAGAYHALDKIKAGSGFIDKIKSLSGSAGFDIWGSLSESDRNKIIADAEDGMDKGEVSTAVKRIKELFEKVGFQDPTSAVQKRQNEFISAVTTYAEVNTQFVKAVDSALGTRFGLDLEKHSPKATEEKR